MPKRKSTGNSTDAGQAIVRRKSQSTTNLNLYVSGFGLAEGGDTLVQCGDNGRFLVPSSLLRSSFPRLINNSPASKISAIHFPYSTDVLRLIIRFISNRTFQPHEDKCTSEFIADCFAAAADYKLTSLTAWLRSQLALPNSPFYVGDDPITAYALCNTHDFWPEKELAFRRCIGQINLNSKGSVDEFIEDCSDTGSALELLGRLAFRTSVIANMFGSLHLYPLDARSFAWGTHNNLDAQFKGLTCKKCRDWTIFRPPSWLPLWAHRAKNVLLNNPGEECDHVFRAEFMGKRFTSTELFGPGEADIEEEQGRQLDHPVLCQDCLKFIMFDPASEWDDWAAVVKQNLQLRLKDDF